MASSGDAPRTVAFALSFACPLRCSHCPQSEYSSEARRQHGCFDGDGLKQAILSLDKRLFGTVLMTGGEPTLHIRLLARGLDACHEIGVTSVVTSAPVWAPSLDAARRMLRRLPRFDVLVLGCDRYHLEFLTLEHYHNAIEAARECGIGTAVNLTYAGDDERETVRRRLLPLVDGPRAVNCQPVIPFSASAADRGVSVAGVRIRSAADLRRLPPSCTAGDVLVNFHHQIDLCCWSSTVENSPLRFTYGDDTELGCTLSALQRNPRLQVLKRQGLLGLLSAGGAERVAELVRDESFVNECHLCVSLMSPARRTAWDREISQHGTLP